MNTKEQVKSNHSHTFIAGESNKVAFCACGKWKHINLKPEDIIVEQVKHTTTPWFIVVNTPGVDIRHKLDGQELILVENVNPQIAIKITRAVNSHDDLVNFIKFLLYDGPGHLPSTCKSSDKSETDNCLKCMAMNLIAQAEGK